MTWLLRYWKPLAVALILGAVGAPCWQQGSSRTDAIWQAKRNEHLAADVAATEKAQAEQRAIEQTRQQSINKVTTDAQREIDRAAADAAAARASAGSLRDAADKLAARMAASEAGRDTCTAGASKATAASAQVLAELFKESDRLAEVYAAADELRVRGLACEAAYDAVRGGR